MFLLSQTHCFPASRLLPERVCKPGSVEGDHLSTHTRCRAALAAHPGGRRAASTLPYSALLQVGFTKPPPHDGAGGLLHHRFSSPACGGYWVIGVRCWSRSPASDTQNPIPNTHYPPQAGGFFSVALSLCRSLDTVAVGNHLALWSPDFPPRLLGAITRLARLHGTTLPTRLQLRES